MRAIVFEKVGGPDVLQLKNVPKPIPKEGEVVVRVRACALNLLDYYLRIEEDAEMPMPHIMGSDIAGEIDTLGQGVNNWKLGDQVLVAAAIEVLSGRHQIIGYQTQGGYAEFVSVPASNLLRKPASLSFEEAASIPLAFATAYHQMFTRGGISSGQVTLVMGGSGGVGSAAVQLCRAAGAYVIATVGNDAKRSGVEALGADVVVNHNSPDWTTKVMEATGGQGVNLICEHLGGNFLLKCVELLAHGGKIVTIGSTTGSQLTFDINELFRKEATICGSYMGTHAELAEVLKLVEWGRIRPVVARVFLLEQAAEAHRFLESRQHIGKIVLKVQ